MTIKISRVQSPSSILTYKQCPRKYFYIYIMGLETRPSIHLVRGEIIHTILEDFYKINLKEIENPKVDLKVIVKEMLVREWNNKKTILDCLNLTKEELTFYFEESLLMLLSWVDDFLVQLEYFMNFDSFEDSFKKLTPITEEYYYSPTFGVQGYIDAIHKIDNQIKILDYKTSNKAEITEDYKLQLGIYSLLYYERYGVIPHKASIYFLKYGEKSVDVNHDLLKLAEEEIKSIHINTQSESILDYPKKEGPLCKWKTGKCDFYDICFNTQKT